MNFNQFIEVFHNYYLINDNYNYNDFKKKAKGIYRKVSSIRDFKKRLDQVMEEIGFSMMYVDEKQGMAWLSGLGETDDRYIYYLEVNSLE